MKAGTSAGFFDPGFGFTESGSHEVPFILEDGQVIERLVYEKMAEPPHALYGQAGTSYYQGQGLKLSKHFRMR